MTSDEGEGDPGDGLEGRDFATASPAALEAGPNPWFWRALLVWLTFWMVQMLVSCVAGLMMGVGLGLADRLGFLAPGKTEEFNNSVLIPLTVLIGYPAGFAAACAIVWGWDRASLRVPGWEGIGWGIGPVRDHVIYGSGAAALAAGWWFYARDIVLETPTWVTIFMESGMIGTIVVVVLGIVIAPVAEEFLFRGVALVWLRRRFSGGVSIGLMVVSFVVLHLADLLTIPAAGVSLTLLSLLCVMARLRTGWLGPAVTAHAVYNSVVISAAMLLHTPPE